MAVEGISALLSTYLSSLVNGGNGVLGAQRVTRSATGAEATTSTMANGSAAAPAAAAAIATTADLTAGTWDVEVTATISGTTVATLEADNMRLKIGGTAVAAVLVPVPGTAGGSAAGVLRCRVNIPTGVAPLSVVANANSTASSVYKAQIVASKVGS